MSSIRGSCPICFRVSDSHSEYWPPVTDPEISLHFTGLCITHLVQEQFPEYIFHMHIQEIPMLPKATQRNNNREVLSFTPQWLSKQSRSHFSTSARISAPVDLSVIHLPEPVSRGSGARHPAPPTPQGADFHGWMFLGAPPEHHGCGAPRISTPRVEFPSNTRTLLA